MYTPFYLFMATSHYPPFPPSDQSWKRIRIVPFEFSKKKVDMHYISDAINKLCEETRNGIIDKSKFKLVMCCNTLPIMPAPYDLNVSTEDCLSSEINWDLEL